VVVKAFGYPLGTALAVGLNLSQIGEFVFVLLSVANQQSLLPESVYMLLMGERKPHCFFLSCFFLGYNTMCGWVGGRRGI
jgi:CPA2 family monovalent cation:H+ antiporter-2